MTKSCLIYLQVFTFRYNKSQKSLWKIRVVILVASVRRLILGAFERRTMAELRNGITGSAMRSRQEFKYSRQFIVKLFRILIGLRITWFFIRIIQPQNVDAYNFLIKLDKAMLYISILVFLLVTVIVLRWIFLLHVHLHKIYPGYHISPMLAVFLGFEFVNLVGKWIIFSGIINRLRQEPKYLMVSRSLKRWLILNYVTLLLAGQAHARFWEAREMEQLSLTASLWLIPTIFDYFTSLKLISKTGEIIQRKMLDTA